MNKQIVVFIMSLFLISCGAYKKTNLSNLDIDKLFPDKKYLSAKGSDDLEANAILNAKSEIASIFESKIVSSLSSSVSTVSNSSGQNSFNREVKNDIYSLSTVKIKGLTVGKSWYDNERKKYFVIVVLDRDKTAKIWNEEIKNLDIKMSAFLDAEKKAESTVLKYIKLKKVYDLWLQKKTFETKLKIINRTPISFEDIDFKDIFNKIVSLKNSMRFFVKIENDENSKVENVLASNFSDNGYLLVKEQNKADVFVQGNFFSSNLDMKRDDNMKFVRVRLSIRILDTFDNKIFEFEENKRAGHLTFKEAENKAINKCLKSIMSKIEADL